jgi:hypothetical protein
MTGGIPQQATDTHLDTDFQSHGKEEIWSCGGNFMKFEVLFVVPKTSDVWAVKARLIMDI